MNTTQKLKAAQQKLKVAQQEVAAAQAQYDGDKPDDTQAKAIKNNRYSFAVAFERRKVLRKVRSPGLVCKSLRRFTSLKEANHHGKRFTKIHGHKGFTVTKVAMKANAWVNWRTGKTNPVLNK